MKTSVLSTFTMPSHGLLSIAREKSHNQAYYYNYKFRVTMFSCLQGFPRLLLYLSSLTVLLLFVMAISNFPLNFQPLLFPSLPPHQVSGDESASCFIVKGEANKLVLLQLCHKILTPTGVWIQFPLSLL